MACSFIQHCILEIDDFLHYLILFSFVRGFFQLCVYMYFQKPELMYYTNKGEEGFFSLK